PVAGGDGGFTHSRKCILSVDCDSEEQPRGEGRHVGLRQRRQDQQRQQKEDQQPGRQPQARAQRKSGRIA
ncbi:DNA binding domain, excisionase family, partial [Dysosmobacter welbionis]